MHVLLWYIAFESFLGGHAEIKGKVHVVLPEWSGLNQFSKRDKLDSH